MTWVIAPELARIAEQVKEMAGTSSKKGKHHDAITFVRTCQEKNIGQLVDCINRFTNPFSEESEDLFNFVTKVVMPEKVKEDLCHDFVIGNMMLCRFVEDRIKSNKCSIWSLIKKGNLNTWKSTTKTLKVKINENVVELKEDRALFARMSVVAKSRPEIDLKEAIGQYEFNLVSKVHFCGRWRYASLPIQERPYEDSREVEQHTSRRKYRFTEFITSPATASSEESVYY